MPPRFFFRQSHNTPQALAVVSKVMNDNPEDARAILLDFDKVLGLDLEHNEFLEVPQEILELGEKRRQAKESKNFEESDKIRAEIESQGFEIRDTGDTFLIFKK